jgi:hypothetical protein
MRMHVRTLLLFLGVFFVKNMDMFVPSNVCVCVCVCASMCCVCDLSRYVMFACQALEYVTNKICVSQLMCVHKIFEQSLYTV